MIEISSLDDLLSLKEDYDIEFKKALGKNKGKLPNDFLETYCAMANTEGGNVFLGVEEDGDSLKLAGIRNGDSLVKELFDTLNNPQKISCNILSHDDIELLTFDESEVLWVKIPKATRKQKPIYKGQNPLMGTYIRQGEGDYKCKEECVKRFLVEQLEDNRDDMVLKGFDLHDIDMESFYAYRNIFKSHKPDHPFNAQNDIEFLRQIRGYRKDRESGIEGLTLAGLLMFGKLNAIQDNYPYYMLDYQERPKSKTENRWVDRVTLDGSWSGNIFDFYRKVIHKLYENIKIPFKLKNAQREDDTPIHQAIREAFINTLVHADYSERLSVLIVKRPDMFGFRNPGMMRIPVEVAIKGGESDCRNRNLQNMFMLIGYAEKAGSGIPKIFQSWNSQNWTKPLLYEKKEPHPQTLLELRMISLVDEDIIEQIKQILGDAFDILGENERNILVTTFIEEEVNHKRLNEILDLHPSDISNILKSLAEREYLLKDGVGRGTVYRLNYNISTEGINNTTGGVNSSTVGIKNTTEGIRFYKTDEIPQNILNNIYNITAILKKKQRVKKETINPIILDICQYGYFSPEVLSILIHRSKDTTKDYISELVKAKKLKPFFPSSNSPKQAYMLNNEENR